jgi:hypothetical protein
MLDMAKSLGVVGVKINGKEYIDYNRARQFALVPNTNDINRIKNNELNVYNYRLYKQTFENPNYPYWDAVWKYEDYWKRNWNKFKSMLLSVRGVSTSRNNLTFQKNMEMAYYLPNPITRGNVVVLTQEEYNKSGFPYAVFVNMSQ